MREATSPASPTDGTRNERLTYAYGSLDRLASAKATGRVNEFNTSQPAAPSYRVPVRYASGLTEWLDGEPAPGEIGPQLIGAKVFGRESTAVKRLWFDRLLWFMRRARRPPR